MPTKTLLVKYNFSNRETAATRQLTLQTYSRKPMKQLVKFYWVFTTKARDWVKVIALEFAGLLRWMPSKDQWIYAMIFIARMDYLLTSLLYLRVVLTKELIQKRIRTWDVMRTATLVWRQHWCFREWNGTESCTLTTYLPAPHAVSVNGLLPKIRQTNMTVA